MDGRNWVRSIQTKNLRDAFTGKVDFYDSRWKILFEVERVAYGRIEGYIRLGK